MASDNRWVTTVPIAANTNSQPRRRFVHSASQAPNSAAPTGRAYARYLQISALPRAAATTMLNRKVAHSGSRRRSRVHCPAHALAAYRCRRRRSHHVLKRRKLDVAPKHDILLKLPADNSPSPVRRDTRCRHTTALAMAGAYRQRVAILVEPDLPVNPEQGNDPTEFAAQRSHHRQNRSHALPPDNRIGGRRDHRVRAEVDEVGWCAKIKAGRQTHNAKFGAGYFGWSFRAINQTQER